MRPEDCLQAGVEEHLLCKDDESVMHIMLWYGSGDAVQVRRSQAKSASARSWWFIGAC